MQYEGGHRIPFIAWWPGVIVPGKVTRQTVSLTDLIATCAALAGEGLPDDAAEDSYNILPVLLGTQPVDIPIRTYTLLKTGIRRGPWKYLDHQGCGGPTRGVHSYMNPLLKPYDLPEKEPDAPGQLYNLDDDPGETTNLYFKHPDIVNELKTQYELYIRSGRSAPLR